MKCCLFHQKTVSFSKDDFELVEFYGDCYKDAHGKVIHWLHTWDDGYRSLIRCKKCNALILQQNSEFHGAHDSYYIDLFPVESRAEAEALNASMDGFAIEQNFQGIWLCSSKSGWIFRGNYSVTNE